MSFCVIFVRRIESFTSKSRTGFYRYSSSSSLERRIDVLKLAARTGQSDLLGDHLNGSRDLIRSIFGLPLTDSVRRQDKEVIQESLTAYSSFLQLKKGLAQKEKFDAFEKKTVRRHFPKYGCTLLSFHELRSSIHPMAHLKLLGLDEWTMDVHMSKGGSTYESTSLGWKDLYCGSVPVDRLEELDIVIEIYLREVQKRKGNDRSAAGGEKGHQRTPACIEGIIKNACDDVNIGKIIDDESASTSLPRGAFADVGLHTGGCKRETAWPLARAIIGTFLQQSSTETEALKREMLDFQRFILCNRKGLPWWNQGVIDKESADLTMQMIHSTTRLGAELSEGGYDINGLEKELAETRETLDAEVKDRDENAAKVLSLYVFDT